MTEPFDPHKLLQKSREMSFGRDVPGREKGDEDQGIGPVKKLFESQTRFPMENRKQNENCERINQPEQTFRQASERAANPKPEKPKRATSPALITAHAAKDRTGDECAEDRLGHDHAPEDSCS